MSEQPLNPQTPGADPTASLSKIDELAAGNLPALIDGINDLADADLETLAAAEKKGKNRTGALDAISRLQAQRAAALTEQAPGAGDPAAPAPIGDTNHADQPASAVDPRTITSPVLTRDGWVLPLPRAEAQG